MSIQEKENELAEILKLSLLATIRQELTNNWIRIEVLKDQISSLQGEKRNLLEKLKELGYVPK